LSPFAGHSLARPISLSLPLSSRLGNGRGQGSKSRRGRDLGHRFGG
jgi:hypothetical protein